MSIISANFGKYAISDCPFITCQNLKFWQVCSFVGLLLAKITILASMLVGHVCLLLAKITILASMLVGHVCLFVCLFVCTEIS